MFVDRALGVMSAPSDSLWAPSLVGLLVVRIHGFVDALRLQLLFARAVRPAERVERTQVRVARLGLDPLHANRTPKLFSALILAHLITPLDWFNSIIYVDFIRPPVATGGTQFRVDGVDRLN